MKKRFQKLSRILIAILALTAVLSLTSCSVIDDFQRVGLRGWLNTGVKKGVSTTAVPSPSAPPASSDTPGVTPLPTKLPVIPEIPDMQELISSLNLNLPDERSFFMYLSGTPNVYKYYGGSVEKQNNLIYDKFGFTVISHNDSAENIEKMLSGDDYLADLLYIPLSQAVSLAEKGMLAPFGDEQNYGNWELLNITNRSDKEYYALPSFSVPYESNIVIFCNTELLARIGQYTDITEKTANGEFDTALFSRMLDISSLPEGVCTLVSKFDSEKLERIFMSAAGYEESGISKKVLDALDNKGSEDASGEFYKGNALFMIADVSDIRELYDSYDSYAVLPMPKTDVSDTDYPAIFDSDTLYVYAIPEGAANSEVAKAYVKARCVASKYQFRYEFAESLYSYYLRQESSTPYMGVSLLRGLCDLAENAEGSENPDNTAIPDSTD